MIGGNCIFPSIDVDVVESSNIHVHGPSYPILITPIRQKPTINEQTTGNPRGGPRTNSLQYYLAL